MIAVPDFKEFAAQQLAENMSNYNELMAETTTTDSVSKLTVTTQIYALEKLFDKAGADIDMPMIGDFYDKLAIDGVDYPIAKNDNVKRAIAAHTKQPIRTDFRIAVSAPTGRTGVSIPKKPACYESNDEAFGIAIHTAKKTIQIWNEMAGSDMFVMCDNAATDHNHVAICHEENGNRIVDMVYHVYPVIVNEELLTSKFNAPARYISIYHYRGFRISSNENHTRFTVMTDELMTRGTLNNAMCAIEAYLAAKD